MIRIGIICPSEIALRRFLPALQKCPDFEYIGVAVANLSEWEGADQLVIDKEFEKAEHFKTQFGGKIFSSYKSLIQSDVDAIYLPLPPALHYKWTIMALNAGKNVLLEKPSTISYSHTKKLIEIAMQKQLALHENYMFVYHNQIDTINEIIRNKEIGDIRLYRLAFGFPKRSQNDFRYNKKLGGGALLDCGGYTFRYAALLLGNTVKIAQATKNYTAEFDVDIFGSATLTNQDGLTVQVAFGMDNNYKCDLEVWGSTGYLSTNRIFTAPEGFVPTLLIKKGNDTTNIDLPSDDTFLKSIQRFKKEIELQTERELSYSEIELQALLVNEFIKKSK